jgi:uncharacterized protein (TIGR00369 family)
VSGALDVASLQAMLDSVPVSQFIPLRVTELDVSQGFLELRCRPQAAHGRSQGAEQVHGGVIAALVDIAAACVVGATARAEAATVDLRVDYLRPASGDLTIAARCLRLGRRIATADVVISKLEGDEVAVGRVALVPLHAREGEGR